MKIRFNITIC